MIATFVLTSDLIKQTEYTICHADETLNQLFDGTVPGVTPSWSGADSFSTTAQQISTNFQNTLPDATTKFTSTEYQAVSDSTAGSAYFAAVSYNCPSALRTTTVNCPFANFFECSGGSATQLPIYSEQFCNSSFEGSASFLILNEQEQNSTTWHDSLVSQNTEILSFGTTPADFSTLLSESQQLQSAITDYKPQLRDSITMVNVP